MGNSRERQRKDMQETYKIRSTTMYGKDTAEGQYTAQPKAGGRVRHCSFGRTCSWCCHFRCLCSACRAHQRQGIGRFSRCGHGAAPAFAADRLPHHSRTADTTHGLRDLSCRWISAVMTPSQRRPNGDDPTASMPRGVGHAHHRVPANIHHHLSAHRRSSTGGNHWRAQNTGIASHELCSAFRRLSTKVEYRLDRGKQTFLLFNGSPVAIQHPQRVLVFVTRRLLRDTRLRHLLIVRDEKRLV